MKLMIVRELNYEYYAIKYHRDSDARLCDISKLLIEILIKNLMP